MKRAFVLLAAAALLFAGSVPSILAQGKGKVRGIVYDEETGQPLEGVTVNMVNVATASSQSPPPVTDKEGKWSAYFIRTGMWNLDFEKVGYFPQKVSYRIVFEPGAKLEVFELKLRRMRDIVVVEGVVPLVRKADKLYAEKKYDEALALYRTILKDNPDIYILNKNIGNCHFAKEEYAQAVAGYMKVFEKNPAQSDILTAIANTYNNWGKREEAAEWYKKIPPAEIRDVDTAYNSGILIYNGGNAEGALPYLSRALAIDPEFADAHYWMGMAFVSLGKTDEATASLKRFLELAPYSPNAATARSVIDALVKK
jgi:Flp pilus assembly protein TadD/5-hydroxyisourate hydrolase-like protein (transthyretin family)